MEIDIITFGKISEIIPNGIMSFAAVTDTDELKAILEQRYPQLAGIKYKLALNKTLIQENKPVTDGVTVAIMPPFSGG
ncbi:MoaD/ThiS family protein [Mucilaginibacter achroorhodeus]|uniref:MoaD/ThiS family protein n=1 Tax=Mucilaginibacter achroorhodeus TaxID=2599294 RepID=A0A563TZY8_9SPHI|nr:MULTISPECIES: MoaD/ThiS family protein [Mucilaginibacter]QXV65957.1 MoaD/ThiS family protein [Mucilaginibacter sp. 21P]TWR24171.1 MoaD/ThiS family protein [Mucilaginibacter achroorhodeus]